MHQPKTEPVQMQQSAAKMKSVERLLYRPLDFVMVRTPLLPIEAYFALSDKIDRSGAEDGATNHIYFQDGTLVPRDPRVRWALAVGSSVLLDDLERSSPFSKDAINLNGKLLRYLIRMSTRSTPFGLFAGVALGEWGQGTNLALAKQLPHIRTRPDMAWLLTIIRELESRLDVRRHLRLVANSTAFIRGDRIFMSERSPIGASNMVGVSVRASNVVKKALALARTPIEYSDLAEKLLSSIPGATPEKVERLIAELWEQTLLFTDLRPPLTTDNPAEYVAQQLMGIPSAQEALTQLKSVMDAAAKHDELPAELGSVAYRRLVSQANQVNKAAAETPVQVDMSLALNGQYIAQAVGTEVARAAELLLRMTPLPQGLPYFEAYRRVFVTRYGHNREIPLLELLDPDFGLGSPSTYSSGSNGIAQSKFAERSQTLLNLAYTALHDRKQIIELDADILKRLETWTPLAAMVPPSVDLNVFVAASSVKAIDSGQFQIIIGPNLGAQAAGRNLGRFADLIGHKACEALERAARAEEAHTPSKLWAELVYLPRKPRSANVVIRPATRKHEIVIGTSPGVDPSQVIPADELVVGIKNNRLYIRWLQENKEIVISAGHMLNNLQAPGLCRFLAEVSRDGIAQMSPFDWGPASNFPFLPRVQSGRIVLRLAQWRIDALTRMLTLSLDTRSVFRENLECWRERWQVPRYVYLSTGDNRLLLDLEDALQVEELRKEVKHLRDGRQIILQEVLPALDQVWLEGPEGHYITELVTSLVLRETPGHSQNEVEISNVAAYTVNSPLMPLSSVSSIDRLRPPGSEWLFIKLYCEKAFEEDLIAYPIRTFAKEALSDGLVEEWFFIRYNDPDLHIRLRFRGESEKLLGQLLPRLCTWANGLMTDGYCTRFVFDTYDREIERYGGIAGTRVAESIFAADSRTTCELLYLLQERILQLDRITLAVSSVNNLLTNLGLTETAQLQWLQHNVNSRNEVGQEYRKLKVLLRSLLHEPGRMLKEAGGDAVVEAFATQSSALASIAVQLKDLIARSEMSQSLDALYSSFVHMHCNRLFGSDRSAERRILGLLLRTREGLRASGV